jgi:hypothetical protein
MSYVVNSIKKERLFSTDYIPSQRIIRMVIQRMDQFFRSFLILLIFLKRFLLVLNYNLF